MRVATALPNAPVVAGIRISHPDRPIYPELGVSKLDLVRYYEEIGEWIVPHVQGRPLTLVHCPSGVGGACMYMKHAKAWGPTALRRVRIQEKTKVGEYLVADDVSAVIALAQMGIVEIHTWNSTDDDVERPNRIVWDLDPGPQIAWKPIADAAVLLRDVLTAIKLKSWVKTTGGRGLHVVVPIARKLSIFQLTEKTCKWPIGDPSLEDFPFCGHDSLENLPYCEYHAGVAYQAPEPRRRMRRTA
jgi:bifunctional non-homologous end joining protein LigD